MKQSMHVCRVRAYQRAADFVQNLRICRGLLSFGGGKATFNYKFAKARNELIVCLPRLEVAGSFCAIGFDAGGSGFGSGASGYLFQAGAGPHEGGFGLEEGLGGSSEFAAGSLNIEI
jgi:hypothetical protein